MKQYYFLLTGDESFIGRSYGKWLKSLRVTCCVLLQQMIITDAKKKNIIFSYVLMW